ncbi:MAG: tetratricopeptide repeat protein [Candidatus Hydrogenedentota bacterium]
MTPEKLVRWTVIVALLNFAATSTLLFGRPDLATRESSEKIFTVAMDLEKQKKFAEAAELYESIFYGMSATLIAPRAGERLANIYRSRMLDVDKARTVLREVAAFKESAYAEKAQADLAFMETHWGEDGSILKIWYEADASYRAKDYSKTLEILNRIAKEFPNSTLRPPSMMHIAKINKKLQKNEEAARVLREFLTAYPKDSAANEARTLLRSVQ